MCVKILPTNIITIYRDQLEEYVQQSLIRKVSRWNRRLLIHGCQSGRKQKLSNRILKNSEILQLSTDPCPLGK